MPPLLSIVVPAFNEGENIGRFFDETVRMLRSSSAAGRYEIIFVNDGSTDDTAEELSRLSHHPFVRVIHHEVNRGFGAAQRTGIEHSSGTYVTSCPSDGEVKVDQNLRLLESMGAAHLAISKRGTYRGNGDDSPRSLMREFYSLGFHVLARLLLGFDSSKITGIYVVHGELARRLPLKSDTGLVSAEIYLSCTHLGAAIHYGQIEISPRLGGASKIANLRGILLQLQEMVRFRIQARGRPRDIKMADFKTEDRLPKAA